MDRDNYASGHPGQRNNNNINEEQQQQHHQQTDTWAMLRYGLQDGGGVDEPGNNESQLPTSNNVNVQQHRHSFLQQHVVAAAGHGADPTMLPHHQQHGFASLLASTSMANNNNTFGDVVRRRSINSTGFDNLTDPAGLVGSSRVVGNSSNSSANNNNTAEDAAITLEDMIGPDTVMAADLIALGTLLSASPVAARATARAAAQQQQQQISPGTQLSNSAFMAAFLQQQQQNQMPNNNYNMMRMTCGGGGGMEQQPLSPTLLPQPFVFQQQVVRGTSTDNNAAPSASTPRSLDAGSSNLSPNHLSSASAALVGVGEHALLLQQAQQQQQRHHHSVAFASSIPQQQQQQPPLQTDFANVQELQQSQSIISAQLQELHDLQLQLQQLQQQAMMQPRQQQQQGLYEQQQQQQQPIPPRPPEQLSNQNAARSSAPDTDSGAGSNNPPTMAVLLPYGAAAGMNHHQNQGGATGTTTTTAQHQQQTRMAAAMNPFLLPPQFGGFPPTAATTQNPFLAFPQPLARVTRTSSLDALLLSSSGRGGHGIATTFPPSLGSLNPAVGFAFPPPLASRRVPRTSSLEALLSSSLAAADPLAYLTDSLPGAATAASASSSSRRGSKKSHHRDKNKPKRPLSAYNLFFKDERVRMLTDLEDMKKKSNESGLKRKRVDESTIGGPVDSLEDNDVHDDNDDNVKPPARDVNNSNNDTQQVEQLQLTKKGKIGFAAMAQAIAAKWKLIDEQTLSHYSEIASEDMKRYRKEMETYNKHDGGSGGKNDDDNEVEEDD